ncbi:MAG TPA: tRNA (adenosine(37)-N6)-threonylcarbamoyltransferase complex ATPase subunit type 1 TsaE [Candidatus Polarisedimenticolia bacterium]|nr:tRNA (adenosine(37)-N6)-threonylcarbamoyltransferase complex ATPase subunit type 1 TsaE [Candidatus Polarisedimenticolia bacterium]
MPAPRRHIVSRSEAETRRAGERLGGTLRAGDTVLLHGDLGMGKTVFARGVAAALGVPENEIRSPTFTLVNPHQGRLSLYHIDLYRIEKLEDLDELGLEEIIGGDGIALIEWGGRAGPYKPARCVEVTIVDGGGSRREIRIDDRRD